MRMKFNTVLGVAVAVLLNIEGSFCQLDVCGRAPLNTKMTLSATANAGSWPWQVNIYEISTGTHHCSGSLINKDWVLTAAQCTINTMTPIETDLIINLGHINHHGPNPHEVNRTVFQIIKHPNYTQSSLSGNDIALIQLSSPVTFNDYIRPVCLAAAGSIFDEGLSNWVTGWGGTYNGDYTTTDDLLETEVPIVSNCSSFFGTDFGLTITDNMLCAGILNYTGNICASDIGGPLVIKQDFQWIQSGFMIYTDSDVCTFDFKRIKPAVFTRVSPYQEWINSQISSDQPGFVEFPQSTPHPTPHFLNATPYILNLTIPDSSPYIPDLDYCIHDIFSGSSLSLHSYPVSLTFSIISLIFCLFMKVV